MTGCESKQIGENQHFGSISAIKMMEDDHPGYLHFLFRKIINLKGLNIGFQEIAHQMNMFSAVESEHRPTIQLSRQQVSNWFTVNIGKEIAPTEKPLDTNEHCAKRVEWTVQKYGLLTNVLAPVTYIDEKWFYKVSRRRKLKILPKGKYEAEGDEQYKRPKMLSR